MLNPSALGVLETHGLSHLILAATATRPTARHTCS